MAYEVGGTDLCWLAAEDISAYQYRFVTIASDTTNCGSSSAICTAGLTATRLQKRIGRR
jgi:hypothetical protein